MGHLVEGGVQLRKPFSGHWVVSFFCLNLSTIYKSFTGEDSSRRKAPQTDFSTSGSDFFCLIIIKHKFFTGKDLSQRATQTIFGASDSEFFFV